MKNNDLEYLEQPIMFAGHLSERFLTEEEIKAKRDKYYMGYGTAGAVIVKDSMRLHKMKIYIRDLRSETFTSFAEAEKAALEHLAAVTPKGIPLPGGMLLDQMVSVTSMVKTHRIKEDEKCETP